MKAELAMSCPEEFGFLPDCDCPYEHWHLPEYGACLDVHFEPDNSVHVLILGDETFEAQTTFQGIPDMIQARAKAFAWAETKLQ